MNFTDLVFIPFLLIVLTLYYMLHNRTALVALLLGASCLFYAWWDVHFLVLLGLAAVIDFVIAKWIAEAESRAEKTALLLISLVWNLGILCTYKYHGFLISNINEALAALHLDARLTARTDIVLPVGISFFVFETLSYTIDVYQGTFRPIRRLSDFAIFVSFFPHLVAGPVVRAKDFLPQLQRNFKEHIDDSGLFYILYGFAKKLLLADVLGAVVVDPVFAAPGKFGTLEQVFAVYCYAFQIFLDFSGYTDIAIGIARLLGFDLGVSFNAPYLSRSFGEFWRRWHISLSTWFRDYVYIPLGGSQVKSRARMYLNLVVVFFLSGLWHGASWKFAIWGLLNGAYLIAEHCLGGWLPERWGRPLSDSRPWGWLARALVFNGICLAWVFFRAEDVGHAWALLVGLTHWTPSTWGLMSGRVAAAFVLCVVTHGLIEPRKDALAKRFVTSPLPARLAAATLLLVGVFDLAINRIAHKTFIYFQF